MTDIKIYVRRYNLAPILDIILESSNIYSYAVMLALALSLIDKAQEFEGVIYETEPNWNQRNDKETKITVFFKLIFKSRQNLEKFVKHLNS